MPTIIFDDNSYVLYTNYFGICAKNIKELAKKYKNLIVDNAQAFYMPKYGIASFNSLRKFFGVPDGSFLMCDKTINEIFKSFFISLNLFWEEYSATSFDIATGIPEVEIVKKREYKGKISWYSPIPTLPIILASGMR